MPLVNAQTELTGHTREPRRKLSTVHVVPTSLYFADDRLNCKLGIRPHHSEAEGHLVRRTGFLTYMTKSSLPNKRPAISQCYSLLIMIVYTYGMSYKRWSLYTNSLADQKTGI